MLRQGETRDERGAFCAGVDVPTLFRGNLTGRGYVYLISFENCRITGISAEYKGDICWLEKN